jgi:hypothetical protein
MINTLYFRTSVVFSNLLFLLLIIKSPPYPATLFYFFVASWACTMRDFQYHFLSAVRDGLCSILAAVPVPREVQQSHMLLINEDVAYCQNELKMRIKPFRRKTEGRRDSQTHDKIHASTKRVGFAKTRRYWRWHNKQAQFYRKVTTNIYWVSTYDADCYLHVLHLYRYSHTQDGTSQKVFT